jgi:iron complex outermembrane receptor protein
VRAHSKAIGALVGAFGAAAVSAAAAQTAAPGTQNRTPAAQPQVQSSGEVIVTAQRREERVRDVPLSITAATAAVLTNAGVQNTGDLQKVTPGFMIYMYGGAPQPVIRGISSGGGSAGDSSNVAVYVDGMYLGDEQTQLFDLPDISRVEILKGPQGTLFGRNAAGGAVRVITLSPSFTPTGTLTASYGSFNDVMLKGFVSGPIIHDKLAASLAAYYEHSDGWDHNVLTNKPGGGLKSWLVRGKLLFTPTNDLKITLSGYYLDRNNQASFSGLALGGNTQARAFAPGALIVTKPRDFAVNTPVGSGSNGYGAELNIEYNSPIGTFTSITGYQNAYVFIKADADATPAAIAYYDQHEPINSVQEEVDFASKKLWNRFSFTLGAFYYGASEKFLPLAIDSQPGVVEAELWEDAKTSAWAVFGEGYVDITDKLQAIVGLRYSSERKFGWGHFGPTIVETPFKSATFTALTPRVSLKYSFTPYTNVYFTYSQGFKSGLSDTLDGQLAPEHVYAYEGGLKSRVTPQLELTAAVYHYDYINLQVQTVGNGLMGNGTQSAAQASITGFEGDATWHPIHDLTFIAGLSYIDATYGSFPAAIVNVANSCNCGAPLTPVNVAGKHLQRTPPWTVNLTAEYEHAFAPGTLTADMTVYSTAKWYADLNNRISQPSYTTVDAQLGWQPAGTKLKFSVWGKNLTNALYIYSFFVSAQADEATYAAPTSGGVRIDYSF